jgi:hypothetical protein
MSPVGQQLDWEDQFRRLEAFHRQFGHCRVPKRSSELQPLLRWMADDEIGFVWDMFELKWERCFERLKAFYEARGRVNSFPLRASGDCGLG